MQHLAIIPDGNRRWAKANKLEAVLGHRKGLDAVKNTINVCLRRGIKFLSMYTLSLENFSRRSAMEQNYLFNMLNTEFRGALPDLKKGGVRVRFVGERSVFPPAMQETVDLLEHETAGCETLTLSLLFCYGGKQEIVHAARELAARVSRGELKPEQIDEQMVNSALWTAGTPDPDLIIRTSGIARLSNFLPFQAAYSELMFVDFFWPEMTEQRLDACLEQFATIQRNFGK